MSKTLILKPRVTEKAYALAQRSNRYVFVVPGSANKLSVAAAVKDQFKVSVEDVNITVIKGKAKQAHKKRGGTIKGRNSDSKRAYVTLKAGDTIPVFAAVEAAEAKAEKAQTAVDKAAAKKEKK